MPDHETIYRTAAQRYEQLIAREDYCGNLLKALKDIRSFEGLDIIDIGAGTGRLACLLAPYAKSVTAVDESAAMLQVAAEKLRKAGCGKGTTICSDHRSLPVPDASADVVTAGWTVCYVASSNVDGWERHLRKTLAEIERVLRPGGTAIIIETLGTGCTRPSAPKALAPYYDRLVREYGFESRWIRTDFRFDSTEEAEELIRFFFGDELAGRTAAARSPVVPECTGIWWRRSVGSNH